jgi:hypothetical protein
MLKMRQKLKNVSLLYIVLLLLTGLGLSLSFSDRTASADSLTVQFICEDGSTDVAVTNGANYSSVAKCTSGSLIDYVNYESKGVQPVALAVTCPGSETVSPAVDAPNQPTKQYTFTCVNLTGRIDDGGASTPTTDTPVVKTTSAGGFNCPDGSQPKNNDISNCPVASTSDPALNSGNCSDVNKCDLINKYLNPFVNFLAALVGVAVVASIIIGGIQYGSSAGDPSKVTAAKNRIRNAIIALVTFLFLYALLNFLIPGGLL